MVPLASPCGFAQELGAGDGWEGLDDQGDWAVENEELLSAASTTTIGIDEYDSNTRRSTAEQGVNRAAAASPPPLLDFNVPLGGGSSGGSRSSSKGGTVYMQGGAR